MIVTAWNNGKHHHSGAGYGFKINVKDRDKYFRKDWENIFLKLEGEVEEVVVNTDKASFWNSTCRELICKGIVIWLIKKKKAPWTKGHPPKMRIQHIDSNRFKVEFS